MRNKDRKLMEEYGEAIKFQDTIKKLNFNSVGEFVELVGGIMGMVNVNDIDNAKKICGPFAERIGHILVELNYVDKVIEKNKSMRDFYNEQQRQIKEAAEAKKAAEEAEKEPVISLDVDPALLNIINKSVTAKSVGAGWYELSNGAKVRGKKNLPEGVEVV